MKKSILTAVVVFAAGVFAAQAQTSGDVTVNINLHKFQTLTVNHASVNIDFETQNDYTNGATSGIQDNHLTVSSTGAFVVKATAVAAELNNVTNKTLGETANPLHVTAQAGSTNALTNATYANNTALITDNQIVSSTKGQFNKNVSVEYKANQGLFQNLGLINGDFVSNDQAITTYKVQVTYTISVN